MAVDGIILMQKIGIALWMQKHHNTSGQDINYDELAAQLEEWMYIYKKEWRKVSRESELYRIQNVVFWYADYLTEMWLRLHISKYISKISKKNTCKTSQHTLYYPVFNTYRNV